MCPMPSRIGLQPTGDNQRHKQPHCCNRCSKPGTKGNRSSTPTARRRDFFPSLRRTIGNRITCVGETKGIHSESIQQSQEDNGKPSGGQGRFRNGRRLISIGGNSSTHVNATDSQWTADRPAPPGEASSRQAGGRKEPTTSTRQQRNKGMNASGAARLHAFILAQLAFFDGLLASARRFALSPTIHHPSCGPNWQILFARLPLAPTFGLLYS